MAERNAPADFERAEDFLYNGVLPSRKAWPPHYQEAEDQVGILLDKFLEPAQSDELVGALGDQAGAAEGFHLRIGFELGRRYAAAGALSELDVCQAVVDAGGNPGRSLADAVEGLLSRVVPEEASAA